jgi:hypothetical protein
LVEFGGIRPDIEMAEAPGHPDTEFGLGVGFAGTARLDRRRKAAQRPEPVLDAEPRTRDVVDVPGVVLCRRPTGDANAVDDPGVLLGRSHGSEVAQLRASPVGQKPLFAGTEKTLALQRPTQDLARICHRSAPLHSRNQPLDHQGEQRFHVINFHVPLQSKIKVALAAHTACPTGSFKRSLFAQKEVYHPTPFHMDAPRSAVVQDILAVAPSVLKGVGQDRHPVKGTVGVDASGKRKHGRREPRGVYGGGPERISEDTANYRCLTCKAVMCDCGSGVERFK